MYKLGGWTLRPSVTTLALGDLLVALACFYAGYFTRYAEVSTLSSELIAYLPQALLYGSMLLAGMLAVGVYEHEALASLRVGAMRVAAGLLLTVILLAVVVFWLPSLSVWRSGLLIALPASFMAQLGLRWLFLRTAAVRAFSRRVIVLGDAGAGQQVEAIRQARALPAFDVAAEIELDDPRLQADPLWLGVQTRRHEASEIVVVTRERRRRLPLPALLECKLTGTRVSEYHDFCERETGRVDLDRLNPGWLVFSHGFGNTPVDRLGKRLVDIVLAVLGIAAASPLLLLTAAAVRLDDGGPVLYRQLRVGRGGTPFPLLKFRSMRTDAEALGAQWAQWAQANDPRVTRVGRIIRRTRLDELPQLINVLRGEMSLVGPRPERPVFVAELARELPYFQERHRVKPGIAGWAQLNYTYTASMEDARTKLEYDMYYLKNRTLFMDLAILAQTLRVVIWGQGVR